MAKELGGGVINLGAKIQSEMAEWIDGRKQRSDQRRRGTLNSVAEENIPKTLRESNDDVQLPHAEVSGNRLHKIYDLMDAEPDEWENVQSK